MNIQTCGCFRFFLFSGVHHGISSKTQLIQVFCSGIYFTRWIDFSLVGTHKSSMVTLPMAVCKASGHDFWHGKIWGEDYQKTEMVWLFSIFDDFDKPPVSSITKKIHRELHITFNDFPCNKQQRFASVAAASLRIEGSTMVTCLVSMQLGVVF